jgi:hypothetical protein
MSDARPLSVLVLGASYGILPATRIALGGHAATLVGRADEIATMAGQGIELRLPLRGRADGMVLRPPCASGPAAGGGRLGLQVPGEVDAGEHDLVLLAMQEPQYAAPEVDALVGRVAAAGLPCVSIMNMPPLAFLRRLPGVDADSVADVYGSAATWARLDPRWITMASPDAQAVRPDPARPGLIAVTLATNFKVAPFAEPAHQELLRRLAAAVDATRVALGGDTLAPPVRLVAHPSLHVPLAKWPMLIAGNCRCVGDDGPIPIAEAVWRDPERARAIYEWVMGVASALGAPAGDLVPFDRYAAAARDLALPSSLARALAAGAVRVERVDRVVQRLARAHDLFSPDLDGIVARIDSRLAGNRAAAEAHSPAS